MAIIKSKRGLAFSFLVFFLAIILFAFLHLELSRDEFTKDNVFIDSRISFISEELVYFKTVYLKNAVSYSFYNTMNSLANYSRDNDNFKYLNQNYSKLNDLVYEGMINGSFDGNVQIGLVGGKDKTLNYFFEKYIDEFNSNYRSNLTLDVIDINVYENQPYYLTIQMLINWSVETSDNLSQWNSLENIFISVPVQDLPVPDFLYYKDLKVPSKSIEYNLPDQNWSLSNFQRTINESYSALFYEKEHKYYVGNSYLKRFLNVSYGSYLGTIGFWSFDYDEDEGEIYDSSLNNNISYHYGNSFGLYDFNNDSVEVNILDDLSDYENNGTINGGVDCENNGIFGEACYFSGANGDDITLNNFPEIEKEISVFAWINLNDTTSNGNQRIVCSSSEYFCYWINDVSGSVEIRLGNALTSGVQTFVEFSDVNISKNQWNHIGFTYDGNYTFLYLNGVRYTSLLSDGGSSHYNGELNGGVEDVQIGNTPSGNFPFNGLIDEVGIFSRVLTRDEISQLYNNRKVYDVDYKTSFHDKGIYFDGKDDYINLGNENVYDFDDELIGVEMWVKLFNVSNNNAILDKGIAGSDGWGIHIDANGRIEVGKHGGGSARTNPLVINKTNYWYHIVINGFDNNEPEVYVNAKKYPVTTINSWPKAKTIPNYNLTIGKLSDSDSWYFNGIIDEIKIYNRSLSKEEISNNYLAYDSFGKGCCNYLLLMNPNKFGYNIAAYENNVSYSTKIFYDYYVRGIDYNISLYNLSNVTQSDTSKNFHNFLFDDCIQHAFSVSDYQTADSQINMELYKLNGVDDASCSNLVKLGIY